MKTIFLLIASILLKTSLVGQVINLKQKKSDADIKIINGTYQLYFNKTDVINAINDIDKKLNTNNTAIIEQVKNNQIKVVEFKPLSKENKGFAELLEKNLGLYLLLKEKGAVYEGQKQIVKLIVDEAPNEVDLDGTVTRRILISEENSEKQVFLGWMLAKLME